MRARWLRIPFECCIVLRGRAPGEDGTSLIARPFSEPQLSKSTCADWRISRRGLFSSLNKQPDNRSADREAVFIEVTGTGQL